MNFGAKRSDKCGKDEIVSFKKKVLSFLITNKLPFKKIIGLTSYGGQVKIFTGGKMSRLRLRMGRKLIAFKTPSGKIEGTPEGIKELQNGGDLCYSQTNEPIEEKEYFPVYLVDNWEEEKEYLLKELKKEAN